MNRHPQPFCRRLPAPVGWRVVAGLAAVLGWGGGAALAAEPSRAVAGSHWAYQAPVRPVVPRAPLRPTQALRRNAIDAFVQQRLEQEGLEPAPEAGRESLLRRVTLDLTGLPPTFAEVEAFRHDPAPDAYERVVDRLLASPSYGERMAWEWLEAARYADSNGYQGDAERTMWPWRDWVVSALNCNLPFDQFTVAQLAGDLLPSPTFEQKLATGFVRNHMINGEGGRIAEENRIDYLFDQTETVGTVWLGATLNCSRCHDHKFDPVTQRDYYGLLACFNRTAIDGSGGDPQARPNLEVPTPEQRDQRRSAEVIAEAAAGRTEAFEVEKFPRGKGEPLEKSPALAELPEDIRASLKVPVRQRDAGRLEKLAEYWKEKDASYATSLGAQRRAVQDREAIQRGIPKVMVMEDAPSERETFVLRRGIYTQPGAKVAPAVPAHLGSPQVREGTGGISNRLDLAHWLLHPGHPLTARVTVNRYWQLFFGVGLVKTAEDFGVQGERPSHPLLLDWLATEFIESGWDVKHLHRLIVTSATYRQTSRVEAKARERDPENRLLARGPRMRLPSWMIRDAALHAAGLLVDQVGGPPVRPYQPSGVWEEATFGAKRYAPDQGAGLYRRSLYVFWRRIVGPTMFFDVASRQTCTVRTPRTNVPLHALLTLNDTTYVEAARVLAEQLLRTGGDASSDARLDHLARLVLGREWSAEEKRILIAGLERNRHGFAADEAAARRLLRTGASPRDENLSAVELASWTLACSTVLNLDEALSKE